MSIVCSLKVKIKKSLCKPLYNKQREIWFNKKMSSNRYHMFIFLIANIETFIIAFHMWRFGISMKIVFG